MEIPAIIVISHGDFCEGLVRSAKMIFGETDRLEALPLEEGMDPEQYEAMLGALVDKYEGNVFVCCDILGGTPFNSLAKLARTRQMYGVAGISMPILLEILSSRDFARDAELAAMGAEACAAMPIDLTEQLSRLYKRA